MKASEIKLHTTEYAYKHEYSYLARDWRTRKLGNLSPVRGVVVEVGVRNPYGSRHDQVRLANDEIVPTRHILMPWSEFEQKLEKERQEEALEEERRHERWREREAKQQEIVKALTQLGLDREDFQLIGMEARMTLRAIQKLGDGMCAECGGLIPPDYLCPTCRG